MGLQVSSKLRNVDGTSSTCAWCHYLNNGEPRPQHPVLFLGHGVKSRLSIQNECEDGKCHPVRLLFELSSLLYNKYRGHRRDLWCHGHLWPLKSNQLTLWSPRGWWVPCLSKRTLRSSQSQWNTWTLSTKPDSKHHGRVPLGGWAAAPGQQPCCFSPAAERPVLF